MQPLKIDLKDWMIWDEFKLLFVITDLFKPLVLLEGF